MKDLNVFYYLIGLSAVLLFSWDRFNTPVENRSSTTTSKYFTGFMMYLVTYITFYHALFLLPEFEDVFSQVNPDIVKLPKELASALILTVLLPSIPYIKEYDAVIKRKICYLVNIPHEVLYLAKSMKRSHIAMDEDTLTLVKSGLAEKGFNVEKLFSAGEDLIINNWVKISFLKEKMSHCTDCKEYRGFVDRFGDELKAVIERYDDLTPLVLAYTHASDESLEKDRQIYVKVEKDSGSLLDDMYLLIGRASFSRLNILENKSRILENFGIEINKPTTVLSWDMIAMIFITIFILYGFKYAMEDGGPEAFNTIYLILQIAISYCIAVYWSIYPKLYWELAERKQDEDRKFRYYLVAVFLTIVCVALVRLLILALQGLDIEEFFVKYAAWQIPSASLTLLLCFLLDSHSARVNRWVEGLVGAVYLCVAYGLTLKILGKVHPPVDYIYPFIIGFMVCASVPYWFRNSVEAEGDHQHEAVAKEVNAVI